MVHSVLFGLSILLLSLMPLSAVSAPKNMNTKNIYRDIDNDVTASEKKSSPFTIKETSRGETR